MNRGKGRKAMNIVVLDGHTENPGDLSWAPLEALGRLTVYDRTPDGLTSERMADAEAVYTNKTKLSREIIKSAKKLRFIGVLATGYNVVDIDAAKARGIPVCNVPTYGTMAVAQFTIAMLLELCHHIGAHSDSVHHGDWSRNLDWCYWNYPLVELDGKTLGIVGFGRIGRKVATIGSALGMRIVAYDVKPRDEDRGLARFMPLGKLLSCADVVSLHCPLFPETRGMINHDAIARMKDGAMLLNAARGELIDEQDLCDALNEGKLAGAALDVVGREPIGADNPLLNAKNCILTPHIAWAPKESRQRLMNTSVENLTAFIKGEPCNNVWSKL